MATLAYSTNLTQKISPLETSSTFSYRHKAFNKVKKFLNNDKVRFS